MINQLYTWFMGNFVK